jgi:hypothetical protein
VVLSQSRSLLLAEGLVEQALRRTVEISVNKAIVAFQKDSIARGQSIVLCLGLPVLH